MQNQQELKEQVVATVRAFARSTSSGHKVVADMSALVEATAQLPLANLDYWERLIRQEFFFALHSYSPPKWKVWVKPSTFLTWIDLSSPDGYKREKTLRTLIGPAPNSFFFALAVRRLNDWVAQVREAARECIPLIAKETDPIHVVNALFAILPYWNSWGRMEESDKQILLNIVANDDVSRTLKSKLTTATSGPLTTIFAQIGRTPVLDSQLYEIARCAVQPSVRAKAYRSQLERKMTWVDGQKWEWTDVRYCKGRLKPVLFEREINVTAPFLEILKTASADRSPIVRSVAAEMLIRQFETLGSEALQLANLFASDVSPSVAERGKFCLKKLVVRNA